MRSINIEAYTIGGTKSYDKALSELDRVIKLGRDDTENYPGGWVWKTSGEAQAFIEAQGKDLGFKASVYRLELTNGWEQDVNQTPGPDGVHNLINDALIIEKV